MRVRTLFLPVILALGLLAGMSVLLPVYADPGTLFVKPASTGTACTQATPCALQAALSQATDGDTLYLAQGTYTGTGAAVIALTQSITLYGGWDGAPIGPVVRDPALYLTILDGEGARRVISITGDVTPTIEGFIITRGNGTGLLAGCPATGGKPDGCGGGIFSYGAHPIIVNNVTTNNVAAITTQGYPTGTTGYGGGIYLYNADRAVISGNVVISNVASTVNAGMGGGICLYGSGTGLVVQANQVLSNAASLANVAGWGGGIAGGPDGALIQGNRVEGNRDNAKGSGYGAGIYQWYGSATYRDNLVRGNIGAHAVYLGYSNSRFEDNRILDNQTGTGLKLNDSSGPGAVLVNNVVARSGSKTVEADGYVAYPLRAALLHNTLVGSGSGAGIYVDGYVTLALTNTIVAGHTWGITATFPASATISADHTLFWANTGTAITGTNPVFGDPRFLPDGYHLGPGSAAVDAGIDAGVTTDMDGDPRPIGSGYDIGADEAHFLTIYLPLVVRNF
ncbi:MAG: right-handed parallel beta-helix repeat-containing protein [Chloroflexia bacterium]